MDISYGHIEKRVKKGTWIVSLEIISKEGKRVHHVKYNFNACNNREVLKDAYKRVSKLNVNNSIVEIKIKKQD